MKLKPLRWADFRFVARFGETWVVAGALFVVGVLAGALI